MVLDVMLAHTPGPTPRPLSVPPKVERARDGQTPEKALPVVSLSSP
jgi:hypothetical protein